MKKLLSAFLSIIMFSLPALSQIRDDFAESTLDKNLKIKHQPAPTIYDDFINKTCPFNLKIIRQNYCPIVDSFAEKNKNKNVINDIVLDFHENIPKLPQNYKTLKSPRTVFKDPNEMNKIRIKIKNNFTTKSKIDEGEYIEFETIDDVKIKNKNYPKGTLVKARIEMLSQNKTWGVPSDLVVGNFSINGIPLNGEINKVGANRSLWVYPSVHAGCLLFFAGLLLIPIRGGHAKIKTKETFTLHTEY